MPKKRVTKKGGSTAAKQKISVGQKVLIAVGILAGFGAIAAGFGSFDYEAYKRRRVWYAQQQAKVKTAQKTSQTVQTKQKKQAYKRVFPGMVIKETPKGGAPKMAVYYIADDFKRHVFPTSDVYDSWLKGQNMKVTDIPSDQMSKIMVGDNVRYRPGSRPVKLADDPAVYTITKGGVLHEIVSESLMLQLYGPKWALKIKDIPGKFFSDYTIGEKMTSVDSPFHPSQALKDAPTIDHDLGLK